MFNPRIYPIIYRGSVKNLRAIKKPTRNRSGIYLFEFTDDYSIFDYGKMPDSIKNKGSAMAIMTAYIFEKLSSANSWKKLSKSHIWDKIRDEELRKILLESKLIKRLKKTGFYTHYRGIRLKDGRLVKISKLKEPSNIIEVKSVNIIRPERTVINGVVIWNYNVFSPTLKNYLIPIENVFRFGVPKGSSLLDRIDRDPEHLKTLGLSDRPQEGFALPRPVLESFSKLEPSDRLISLESALNFSGLSTEEFASMMEYTLLIAIFLLDLFSSRGIDLWDGKFEFIKEKGLILGDAITPDELRLTKDGVQISKEPIRQYYKRYEKDFYDNIVKAKEIAGEKEISEVLKEDFNCEPNRMDPEFKKAMEDMYVSLTQEITGLKIFGNVSPLEEVIGKISKFI